MHTLRHLLCAFLALMVLAVTGCATSGTERPRPVKVPEVIAMCKAGVPADEIVRKMQASGTVYRLTASQLVELAHQGVPPEVLDYMQNTYLDATRVDASYEEWERWQSFDGYWYGGVPFGWPYESIYLIRPPPPPPHRHP